MFSGEVITSYGLLYIQNLMIAARICFVLLCFVFLKYHFLVIFKVKNLRRHLLQLYVAVFTPDVRRTGRRVVKLGSLQHRRSIKALRSSHRQVGNVPASPYLVLRLICQGQE